MEKTKLEREAGAWHDSLFKASSAADKVPKLD